MEEDIQIMPDVREGRGGEGGKASDGRRAGLDNGLRSDALIDEV